VFVGLMSSTASSAGPPLVRLRTGPCTGRAKGVYVIGPERQCGNPQNDFQGLGGIVMDLFAGAFIFFTSLFLGSILVGGLVALVRVRSGRRECLLMKRHLQRNGLTGGDSEL
jgi:hypothetical protein